MVNKIIGYIFALAGLVGIASKTFPQVDKNLTFLTQIPSDILTIGSIGLILVGILILFSSSSGGRIAKGREVPIYHGNRIVGYRKH